VYRPGNVPRALGVDEPRLYPTDTQLLQVLVHPLRRSPSSAG
jgi:hypothetical protein